MCSKPCQRESSHRCPHRAPAESSKDADGMYGRSAGEPGTPLSLTSIAQFPVAAARVWHSNRLKEFSTAPPALCFCGPAFVCGGLLRRPYLVVLQARAWLSQVALCIARRESSTTPPKGRRSMMRFRRVLWRGSGPVKYQSAVRAHRLDPCCPPQEPRPQLWLESVDYCGRPRRVSLCH